MSRSWWRSVTERPVPGDIISLIEMGPDPCPMQPGTVGVVRSTARWTDETWQLSVDWKPSPNGEQRSLALVWPVDKVKILGRDVPRSAPT